MGGGGYKGTSVSTGTSTTYENGAAQVNELMGYLGTGATFVGEWTNGYNPATSNLGLLNGASSFLGGTLSGVGMIQAGMDMSENGLNVENGMNMFNNAVGLASVLPGPQAAVAGAYSLGNAIGNVANYAADSEYGKWRTDAQGRPIGSDDLWQQQLIDEAIANGEDPSSAWNMIKGTAYGTFGQLADATMAVPGIAGALWDSVFGDGDGGDSGAGVGPGAPSPASTRAAPPQAPPPKPPQQPKPEAEPEPTPMPILSRPEVAPKPPPKPDCGPCFAAGTPVLLADGQIRAIEDVTVGDHVFAYDEGEKQVVSRPVVHTQATPPKTIIALEVEDVGTIRVTPGHRFFTEGQWISAQDLEVGTSLFFYEPRIREAMPKRVLARHTIDTPAVCYNLSVRQFPNYFVHNILVHNAGTSRKTELYPQTPTDLFCS